MWKEWKEFGEWKEWYGEIEPPTLVLHARLADINDKPVYDENFAAQEAAWSEAQADAAEADAQIDGDGDGGFAMMMGGGACETDEEAPFAIEEVWRLTNGWIEIGFSTCTDRVYAVQSTDALSTNTDWQTQAAWVGEGGYVRWTDTTAAETAHAFYRVARLHFDGDSDGDGLSNWEEVMVYGTDPTGPDTDGDGLPDGVDADPLSFDHSAPSFTVTYPTNGSTIYP